MTGTTADLGTLEQAGGLWRLRFARPLAYPPELAWRALTEPEQLQHWFPQRITGQWAAGAAPAPVPSARRASPSYDLVRDSGMPGVTR